MRAAGRGKDNQFCVRAIAAREIFEWSDGGLERKPSESHEDCKSPYYLQANAKNTDWPWWSFRYYATGVEGTVEIGSLCTGGGGSTAAPSQVRRSGSPPHGRRPVSGDPGLGHPNLRYGSWANRRGKHSPVGVVAVQRSQPSQRCLPRCACRYKKYHDPNTYCSGVSRCSVQRYSRI